MPMFPKKQVAILALATRMYTGYRDHMADFPSSDWFQLRIKYVLYETAKNLQSQVKSQVRLATDTKNASLKQLRKVMKNCLRKSQVDTAAGPEKLALIGWGPKTASQPAEVPGQPSELRIIAQGRRTILLNFDRPAGGGTVRNYIIERREQSAGNAEFGPWHIAGTSLNNQIDLANQPRGIQLGYRLIASNPAGQSLPSNTVAVVL